MKTCTGCLLTKELKHFHNSKDGKFKKKSKCKDCVLISSKDYLLQNKTDINNRRSKQYILNKDKIIKRVSIYKKNNIDKINIYQKDYRTINKDKLNKYTLNRNTVDSLFYLKGRLRKSISSSIKRNGFVKLLKTTDVLGCDFLFFKDYIESQFSKGMNWDNIHIDHIKPLKLALNEKEVLQLNHYTNLQPLLAIDNLKKGSKLIEKQLRLI
jgi:hypothetical protein